MATGLGEGEGQAAERRAIGARRGEEMERKRERGQISFGDGESGLEHEVRFVGKRTCSRKRSI